MQTIKIVNSIKEIKKDEWNAMIDDKVFASYGWLKTIEETYIGNINPKYIIVLDSAKLIGASVYYLINKTDKSAYLDDLLLGRLRKFTSKLGVSFLPTFLCGPMSCSGKHLLIAKEADSKYKEIIADEIFTAVEKEASYNRLSVCFYNVMDDEVELVQLLNKRGYIRTLCRPINYLDIEWSSFKGYKNHIRCISKNMQKNIAKEINKNKREGVIIKKYCNIDGSEDRLYELLNDNYLKYNRSSFPFKREFLSKLIENFEENAKVYISFKKNYITGVCLILKRNDSCYLLFVGVDHERTGNDFTYFNITFYRPIMDAISEQMARLHYGNAMYGLKTKRGCKINNTYVYYKPFNNFLKTAIKPWFALHSFWFRKKKYKNIVKRKG